MFNFYHAKMLTSREENEMKKQMKNHETYAGAA